MRPSHFELDYSHPLARGLVFAELGNMAGSTLYYDSSVYKNHGTINNGYSVTQQIGRSGLVLDGSTQWISLTADTTSGGELQERRVSGPHSTNASVSAWGMKFTSTEFGFGRQRSSFP